MAGARGGSHCACKLGPSSSRVHTPLVGAADFKLDGGKVRGPRVSLCRSWSRADYAAYRRDGILISEYVGSLGSKRFRGFLIARSSIRRPLQCDQHIRRTLKRPFAATAPYVSLIPNFIACSRLSHAERCSPASPTPR